MAMSKRLFAAVFSATLLAGSGLAVAGGGSKQAATAAQHAGFAAKSGEVKQVHMHLHHAVNCLVGPGDDGFDDSNANPCASLGNGAIPDTSDAVKRQKLQEAVEAAKSGLATDDLAAAQQSAGETESILSSEM